MIHDYKYVEQPPLSCPIYTFCGFDDDKATKRNMSQWEGYTTESFSLQMVPGDHFFLKESEQLLLDVISEEIEQII